MKFTFHKMLSALYLTRLEGQLSNELSSHTDIQNGLVTEARVHRVTRKLVARTTTAR